MLCRRIDRLSGKEMNELPALCDMAPVIAIRLNAVKHCKGSDGGPQIQAFNVAHSPSGSG